MSLHNNEVLSIVPERISKVGDRYIKEAVTAEHAEFFTVYSHSVGQPRPRTVQDFETHEAAVEFVRNLMNI